MIFFLMLEIKEYADQVQLIFHVIQTKYVYNASGFGLYTGQVCSTADMPRDRAQK